MVGISYLVTAWVVQCLTGSGDGQLPQPGHSGGMLAAIDEIYGANEEMALSNLIFVDLYLFSTLVRL